jgi:hypothetical protein
MLSRLSFQLNAKKIGGVSCLIVFSAFAVSPVKAQVANNLPPENSPSSQIVEERVKIDEVALVDFDTIFQRISSDYKVTIITEGVPLHPILVATQKESLLQLVSTPTRLGTVIERIAAAFDYNVEHPYNRVFLLKKRYTDIEDLPCVTYSEVVHSLQAIDKIMSPYDEAEHKSSISSQEQFFNSLSPEQQQEVSMGISLRDVNEDQRKLAVDAFYHVLLDNKIRWYHQLLSQLLLLTDHRTQFTWMKMDGVTAFGLVGPFGPNGYMWRFPLNNGFTSQIGRGSVLQKSPSSFTLTTQDQTIPTTIDRSLAPGMLANRLPSTRTIVEEVNGQSVVSGTDFHVMVDSAIADKPVCVFGSDKCTADVIIRSLATLYGLQLLVPKPNDYTLTLPSPRPTQSIDDISGEIRRVWPLPLAISLSAQTDVQEAFAPPLSVADARPNMSVEMQKHREFMQRIANQEATNKAYDVYYYPAVRRLLVLTLPAVPTELTPAVSVSDLPHEVLRLIAIARLSGQPMHDIDSLEHFKLPSGFDKTEKLSVRAYKSGNNLTISFGNGTRDSNGQYTWQFVSFMNPGFTSTFR